ncbi:MAG: hypothetical protein IJ264_06575 [Clostridia bacterium]|nr:hypothetical protein [Clostridia bacterium]
MKKIFALLLALVMMFSLAACGDENPDKPDNTKAQSGNSDSGIESSLFTVDFDGDWINIEDEFEDSEDGCTAVLQVLDPDDEEYYMIEAVISVEIDEPYDFREDLVYYGFSQYEYKENNAYETVNIGGVDLLRYDDGDDTLIYFNRVESANASVYVEFDATDINDSHINALLDGITFNIEDIGNEDGPWEWEGEAFYADDTSVNAGAFTVTSSFVPFEAPVTTFETFDHSVAAIGDRVYVLVDGELSECHYDGAALAFVEKIELPEDDYDRIEATADGTLWVSGSMNDILCLKGGNVVATYEDIDNLAIHPSGTWGVNYFTSSECAIVTFNGSTYSSTPVTFKEADTIMHLCVDENNIYVCANAADDSGHKVFIYSKDGVLQKTLCDAEGEGLGSVTFVTQTANGYIAFDGNMRDVLLWDNNGAFVAEISDGDLFSTGYPWFCDSAVLDDGSIITIMTDEREDMSATELVAFIIKGF